MLFKRKFEVKEIDIQLYLKLKENNICDLKTTDMNNTSPHFIYVNENIDNFFVKVNNGIKVEKVEKRNLSDLFKTQKKESLNFKTTKCSTKLLFEKPLKNNVDLKYNLEYFYLKNFNVLVHKFDIEYNIKIKKTKPKKVIEKIPTNQLKRIINKNYIKQLVMKLIQEEKLKLSNIKFYSFYKAVPTGKGIQYSWNKGNLVCEINKNVDLYLDCIVFIDISTDEKYLKFIRR